MLDNLNHHEKLDYSTVTPGCWCWDIKLKCRPCHKMAHFTFLYNNYYVRKTGHARGIMIIM